VGLLPQTKIGKIQFFQSKIAPWTTNATAIGTTSAEVTALAAKVTAAEDAMADHVAAQAAAKTKTQILDDAIDGLVVSGMAIVKQIRAKAGTAGPGVYNLAEIPAPATPTTIGPPGTPTKLQATLNPDGSVALGWTCANPAGSQGTIYHVYRQLEATGEFTFVGGTGTRKFTDTTIPSGLTQVVYQIQAVRSSAIGIAAEFIVKFGTGAGAGTTAMSLPVAPKLAA
jgi:hypothetical protein